MAIASVSIASSTAGNWLKEAQESLAAAQSAGGLLGALNDARRTPGSIKTFLAQSQNSSTGLAMITQNTAQQAGLLAARMADEAASRRMNEMMALAQKLNPQQTNYTPPKGLDAVVYFGNGSSLDTVNNIMTLSNGTQIDTTTGQQVIDTSSIVSMANGAYLDTKNNILTLTDGTRINTITGLKITA